MELESGEPSKRGGCQILPNDVGKGPGSHVCASDRFPRAMGPWPSFTNDSQKKIGEERGGGGERSETMHSTGIKAYSVAPANCHQAR